MQGSIYIVDASPGSLFYHHLLHSGQEPLRTIYETDLGLPLFDVTYQLQPEAKETEPRGSDSECIGRISVSAVRTTLQG